ncbi:TPA: M20 family metallo-hydrolase [Shigella sonnei]|uniref:M20 family metallo-hydrolase n=1 Tax=Shigella sonnei TaxID=624 RepID=UPI0024BC91C9|nr:M20 family metallo-hydrolase [Shigella sonnei]HCR6219957.1 M20 family metallo-hydrolase [Shigella sonnei]HCR7483812.1 M20 family metallo-hydrolase [Shigella sonnei]
MESLNQFVNSLAPKLSHWRRDFHHYAESGWVEFRTATLVAEELQQLGYSLALGREVVNESSRMGLPDELTLQREFERARQQGALAQWIAVFEGGFTGIVATLDTGRPGPVMAFRVDMDALDLSEEQDVSHRPYRDGFASCNAGMMHACGHDGHTAIGLGLAHTLKQFESGLHGVIKLIFQPAEEGTRGARAMVDAGVVDDVDYFTAVHIGTGVPAGTVVCGSDNFMATTKFDAHFTGTAAHAGAKPEDGHNALQAGSGRNVVPTSALLKVETRGASDVINQYVFDRAQQAIQGAATMYGVGVETRLMGAVTASSPSPQWVAWLQSQAAQVAGVNQAIERVEAPAGSEDATLMMARVQQHQGQASYVVFGTQLAAGHHNEKFDFDEQVLAIAVETLARTALNFPWTRGI